MCGIWFSVGFNHPPASVIDSVSHRGPDGRGWNKFTSPHGPVVMAHRRLSIIDLSENGHQPMASEDGRYWLTFNGEIYNYIELRDQLKSLGRTFKTQTDTEVLLQSFLHWGPECLHHFNGMFAFVIWDDYKKTAFIARDRFGVKPLYYYQQGHRIAFASEVKQFTHLPHWKAEVDRNSCWDFLSGALCGFRRGTFFANVERVFPGEYGQLKMESNEPKLHLEKWYDLENHMGTTWTTWESARTTFTEKFIDAIQLRLRSDVPVGAALSGGIDSSSIVCLMSRLNKNSQENALHSFSACFPGYDIDESHYVQEVSRSIPVKNHAVYFESGDIHRVLEKVIYHQDEPFASTSIIAQWFVYEKAKQEGITVMLDGQGADEAIGGYLPMMIGKILSLAKEWRWATFFKLLKERSPSVSLKNRLNELAFYQNPRGYENNVKKNKWTLAPDWLKLDYFNKDIYSLTSLDTYKISPVSSLSELSKWHFRINFPTLLHFADRNSMAHSIESRMPFLDYRFVEYMLSLPHSYKINDHGLTKAIVREAMAPYVPHSVLNRKDKIGFAAPKKEWMKRDNHVKDYVHDNLLNLKDFLHCNKVSYTINNFFNHDAAYDGLIWRLFCFMKWQEIFSVAV